MKALNIIKSEKQKFLKETEPTQKSNRAKLKPDLEQIVGEVKSFMSEFE